MSLHGNPPGQNKNTKKNLGQGHAEFEVCEASKTSQEGPLKRETEPLTHRKLLHAITPTANSPEERGNRKALASANATSLLIRVNEGVRCLQVDNHWATWLVLPQSLENRPRISHLNAHG